MIIPKYICNGKAEYCKSFCYHGDPHEESGGCGTGAPCQSGSGFRCRRITEEEIEMLICQGTRTCGTNCSHKKPHKKKLECSVSCNGRTCVSVNVTTNNEKTFMEVPLFAHPRKRVLIAKSTPKATRQYIRNNNDEY